MGDITDNGTFEQAMIIADGDGIGLEAASKAFSKSFGAATPYTSGFDPLIALQNLASFNR